MSSKKVAMIAAASRGIGAGCARELAAQGYAVSLIARSSSVLDLAQELGGIAGQGSMSNLQDLERWVQTTLDKFGRIDAVVNSLFTKLYAKRYRADKIRMNSIAPFFVADNMEDLEGWDIPSDLMWGRPTTYAELAKTVTFLISDDAKFITGTTLKVDEARSAVI